MFSVILPSRPCLTNPVAIQADPNLPATNFVFTFPAWPKFTHIVVFLLPGMTLPDGAAAAVYIQFTTGTNTNPSPQEFRFLGAIANEKPSAIFRVNDPVRQRTEAEEEDEMLDAGAPPSPNVNMTVTLGISIEPAQTVAAKMATLKAQSEAALVQRADSQQRPNITTKLLAQRIIGNAFNFLSSFATSDGREEVVPLKSFRDWWTKFERRIDADPGFLERAGDA